MGLIKTAMYAGAGIYAVNKISKGYENHQGARSTQQQQQQSQRQGQRQSRDYSPNSSARGNADAYYDNRAAAPQSFIDQPRSTDPSTSAPQEYWYLNNDNEWARVPAEFANMRTTHPDFEQRPMAQYPAPRQQQQLEFQYPQQEYYPQQQQQGYVMEEVNEPRSRSMVGPEQIQQGLGFLMNASSKGGKKGKDDKLSEVMSMFSKHR